MYYKLFQWKSLQTDTNQSALNRKKQDTTLRHYNFDERQLEQ